MKRALTIRRLFAILVIAGLALAPVARPVMAQPASHDQSQAMAHEMSPSAKASGMADEMTDEMAEDMPCCPSKAPMPVDCDKCVFMAGCMTKCFTGMTANVVHLFLVASDSVALERNDSRPAGFGHPPPEHPPRILV